MCLKTCHFTACFTLIWTSNSVFYVNTAREVVTVLFFYLLTFIYIFSYAHTKAHTHLLVQKIRSLSIWSSVLHLNICFIVIFVLGARSLTNPFFRPSQPHRPSIKGTKLLFIVIKAIIIKLQCLVVAIPLVSWLYMCASVFVPLYVHVKICG